MKILQKNNQLVLKDYKLIYFFGGSFLILIFLVNLYYYLNPGTGSLSNSRYYLLSIVSSAICALVGLFLLSIASIVTVTLDKGANRFTFFYRKLFGSRSGEFALNEIQEVGLSRFSTPRFYLQYLITFYLKSGKSVSFDFGTAQSSAAVEKQKKEDAQRIADFIKVRMIEKDPPGYPPGKSRS